VLKWIAGRHFPVCSVEEKWGTKQLGKRLNNLGSERGGRFRYGTTFRPTSSSNTRIHLQISSSEIRRLMVKTQY
jgi:hypothetical protein